MDSPIATLSAVKSNTWVEFDVTAAIQEDGLYSFGLLTTSSNSAIYSSREGANKPVLVITIAGDTATGMPAADTTSENALSPATPSDAMLSLDLPEERLDEEEAAADEEMAEEPLQAEEQNDEEQNDEEQNDEEHTNVNYLFLPIAPTP